MLVAILSALAFLTVTEGNGSFTYGTVYGDQVSGEKVNVSVTGCRTFKETPQGVEVHSGCVRLWLDANCQGESLSLSETDHINLDRYASTDASDHTWWRQAKSYNACDDVEIFTADMYIQKGPYVITKEIQVRSDECKELGWYSEDIIGIVGTAKCIQFWELDECHGPSTSLGKGASDGTMGPSTNPTHLKFKRVSGC